MCSRVSRTFCYILLLPSSPASLLLFSVFRCPDVFDSSSGESSRFGSAPRLVIRLPVSGLLRSCPLPRLVSLLGLSASHAQAALSLTGCALSLLPPSSAFLLSLSVFPHRSYICHILFVSSLRISEYLFRVLQQPFLPESLSMSD